MLWQPHKKKKKTQKQTMLKESICPEHSSKQFKIENKNTLSPKTSIPTSCKGKSIQGTEINLSFEKPNMPWL